MKKISVLTIAIFAIVQISLAQKVTVQPSERSVDKIPHKGMSVTLELEKKFVEKLWKKRLKEFGGKSSGLKGATVIEGASVSDVSSTPAKIMTITSGGKGNVEVWWAIDLGTEWVTQNSSSYSAASNILKDFGMSAYRQDITEQIEDAEKEYEKTVKNLDKAVKDGTTMVAKVESNKSTIEKLKSENIQLEQDIVTNKKDQEGLTKDIGTMKKKVEDTKKKLDMIN